MQKYLCWPMGYSCIGCWSAKSDPKTMFFGTVQFKRHHPRYPKTPLMAYGVQWSGCLERHPRPQTIVFGIVQLQNHHPRYPKTRLLPHGYSGLGVWGATPEPKHGETGINKSRQKPYKTGGGTDRGKNVTAKGSCYIIHSVPQETRGTWGKSTM